MTHGAKPAQDSAGRTILTRLRNRIRIQEVTQSSTSRIPPRIRSSFNPDPRSGDSIKKSAALR